MNFLKRALYSVMRRKGKSLILFLVVFVLGNVIAGSVAIRQSAANVEDSVKADLGAVATLVVDFDAYTSDKGAGFPEVLTGDLIEKVGESSYVADYDYSFSTWLNVTAFKVFSPFGSSDGEFQNEEIKYGSIELKGTSSENPADFKSKTAQIVEGRLPKEDEIQEGKHVASISKQVAEENGLAIGDMAVMDAKAVKSGEVIELITAGDYSVEIIGFYEPVQPVADTDAGQAGSLEEYIDITQYNKVYMPNKAIEEIRNSVRMAEKEVSPQNFVDENGNEINNGMMVQSDPVYTLKNPEDTEAFREETAPLLPRYYRVRTATDKYDEVSGGMKKLSQLSEYVVFVAVIAALIIISLIVVLFARDRKHELGIYLSLGEKRRNVVGQIVIELVVVSLFAMVCSLFTGNLLGKEISDSLLESEMLATPAEENSSVYFNPMADVADMEYLTAEDVQNAYVVEFSAGYALTFLMVGIITITGSAVMPLVYIMRLNPKEIML